MSLKKNTMGCIKALVQNFNTDIGFATLVPLMTEAARANSDTVLLSDFFIAMSDLAQVKEMDSVMEPFWQTILEFALKDIGANTNLELQIREFGMDFVEDLVAFKAKIFKNEAVLGPVLDIALQIGCEDEASFPSDEGTSHDMAMRLIDTLTIKLANKWIYMPLMQKAGACMENPSELVKKSGLMAVAVATQGCADSMKEQLKEIVNTTLNGVKQNESQVVKETAGLCLAYYAEYLNPEIIDFHDQVIPALL